MQEKTDRIQEELERAYRVFRYAEYTGTETEVAYMDGYIAGIKKVIELIIEGDTRDACRIKQDKR